MSKKISPSMMCADLFDLENILEVFRKSKIEFLHLDIMDGSFVGNYTLGTDFCRLMKQKAGIPLDIHLMIEEPERKLDWFDFGEGDMVSVHMESTHHLQRTLNIIREKGAIPAVALNPATPICLLEPVLDDIGAVLVMTVNPGFSGQKLVPSTLKKIADLRQFLNTSGHSDIEIETDGNVSFENAALMSRAGANIFVAGTSSLFSSGETLQARIEKFRKSVCAEI